MNKHFLVGVITLGVILQGLTACSKSAAPNANKPDANQPQDTAASTASYPFRDASLSVDARVDDLVSRLTTTEKIAQMFNDTPAIERLGIPAYNWWNESLHGVARAGKATVYPQAIGLAATFDEDLMLRVATSISDEGRAKYHDFLSKDVRTIYGGLTFWSPNINIFRDPRWGRGQETYGEDPFLTGRMAINFVKGIQGENDNSDYLKAVATIKHYAVHSGPEKTRHSDDYHPTRKDLFETYLPAFRMAIAETNVQSLMCAYNRVDGAPACGNNELMQEILRGDMGFNGYVVSDCGAIADFYESRSHHVVDSPAEAAAWAVKSGTDLNCGDSHGNTYTNLHYALQQGLITEDYIDIAVKRLFKARIKLGMFDEQDRVPYSEIGMDVVGSPKHLALTQEAAEKSIVLLKNNGVLPLKAGVKVAVIGPNAIDEDVLVGNYHGVPVKPVLPLEGIVNRVGEANVFYAPGSSQIADIYSHYEPISAENFYHEDANGNLAAGLKAEYYADYYSAAEINDDTFSATPALNRIDADINFSWPVSPIDNSLDDEFSAVWTGILKPKKSGSYRFSGTVALAINGKPVNGAVNLKAGESYNIKAIFGVQKWWPVNAIHPYGKFTWLDESRDLEEEALAAARKADVIIFMGGIDAHLEGEEMPLELDGFTHGDRTHINLPKVQTNLLKQLKATGKPVVMVNFSGSAMALNWESEKLDAILQAFYPGEATGTALANILWGDVSPSGRLPVTFYKGVDDLPAFNDYHMENRTYKFYRGEPLYAFGHGLGYVDFAYNNLVVANTVEAGKALPIAVSVTNTGKMQAEDVAQVYISLLDAPANTPIRDLKAFKRTKLAAGESTELEFNLPASALTYIDDNGKTQTYTGRVEVTVGSGQKGYVKENAIAVATINVQ
ncbi:glycoside hydrolase family 3 C-terminal domain-containing protein [Saccharophagus degradans]|uniref:Glycoside hydrolase family 3 C-terminal domain-containing protein n=1 Tax=Saccharophagus degradans TaxID=86304 RepID=A0AAW7X2T7_9GAMM|nr:glycoside hydrolase family 3 C-terminal domain-containing protein [Saccharophagus degradans]MDO6421844.1 glycoside hydrolase family 3 C-terminal domain-containing protein [Saccharophagus degradans]MDO6606462.1 glycoside hydrolase family 3 C-terminal domain-containing protein [Saccharophagus degradans]